MPCRTSVIVPLGQVESLILVALAGELKVELKPRRLSLPGWACCDVDGVSPDEMVLVEAFARQGKLLGRQRGKIARDALKLITRGRHRPGAQTIPAVADEPSLRHSPPRTGWRRCSRRSA